MTFPSGRLLKAKHSKADTEFLARPNVELASGMAIDDGGIASRLEAANLQSIVVKGNVGMVAGNSHVPRDRPPPSCFSAKSSLKRCLSYSAPLLLRVRPNRDKLKHLANPRGNGKSPYLTVTKWLLVFKLRRSELGVDGEFDAGGQSKGLGVRVGFQRQRPGRSKPPLTCLC